MKKFKFWGIHTTVFILFAIIAADFCGQKVLVALLACVVLVMLMVLAVVERKNKRKAVMIAQSFDAIGEYYPRIAKVMLKSGECIFIKDKERQVERLFTPYNWETFREDFLKSVCPEDVEKCRVFTSVDNLTGIAAQPGGSGTCIYKRFYMGEYQWVQIVVLAIKDEPDAVLIYAKLLDENLQAGEMQKERLFELMQQAKQAEQEKREFMRYYHTVLSTPADALEGSINLAIEEYGTGRMKEAEQHISTVKTLAEYLKILITDIEQVGVRGETLLSENKTKFSLRTVIGGCEEFYGKIKQPERNVSFKVEMDERLAECYIGDKYRLIQILDAILSNAFRFNKDNGNVNLSVTLDRAEEENDVVRFEVADTGCGISDEFKKCLFDMFTREGTEREGMREGTGIGLYLGKKAVDSMHGEMNVSSIPGEGSRFIFTISFERA